VRIVVSSSVLAVAAMLAAPAQAEAAQDGSGAAVTTAAAAIAADADPSAIRSILVIGNRIDPFAVPGSATVLDQDALATFRYGDASRILRQVPGVNLQEEDGAGLFPNIGLRGSSVERSSNITLMEDGVLIAPAPYAAPAAYYFPQIGRMQSIEIVKGAQAVRYGPRTISGAINLLSTQIPDSPYAGFLSGQIGQDGNYVVHGWAGGTAGQFSALVETYQSGGNGFKELDGGGDTGFEVEDYLARVRWQTPEGAATPMSLEFKFGHTNREANETYLGLSDADFATDPFRRYTASAADNFASNHYQYQLTHTIEAGRAEFVTIAYYNEFARNWFKLENLDIGDGNGFVSPNSFFNNPGTPTSDLGLSILRGETDNSPGALRLRNNNREYYSFGVQSAMTLPWEIGSVENVLTVSARYHEDEEDRLQNYERFQMLGGQLIPTLVDPLGSDANRQAQANAFAFYVQNVIRAGALTLTPGIRYEGVQLTRIDYSTGDPTRSAGPTSVRRNFIEEVLPAIGATYELDEGLLLLASFSRGFSPPGPGSAADPEKSWNYEAGIRFAHGNWEASAIGFFNDYSNLLGDCTNATGCTAGDIGDQFNGGAVDVLGLEAVVAGSFPINDTFSIPVRAVYTYTETEFQQSFDSEFFGDVVAGDALPYIPEHQLYLSAGIESDNMALTFGGNYVSSVRTEAGQGAIPTLERVPSRWVFDLAARFVVSEGIALFGRVDNLFDEEYAVARRPAGLRPGKPQTILGGVEFSF
jgi:Fe(3+) dicitrate transport protein